MAIESKENKKKRILKIISLFERYYPDAQCALDHKTPEQLLFATILSAQCTDERVNLVTPHLFKTYPHLQDLARAKQGDVEKIIKSTGFFRNKAKNIISAAKDLVEKHHSQLPKTIEGMTSLAGVGRKTANVVLGNAFNIASGVVVDTHVRRLSNRLGLVKVQNPEVIERELNELVPKKHWVMFSHWLITHGRAVCKARKPQCETCFLFEFCPKKGV
ncbi:MAG: endonuclease III [Bdellovibrionales bacterium]|nr:endonuclease III [Bdellovibrionales bacterium]